jgi:peptidoglycan/xylan/chitin deacetylase (PgdA/CDA1 family)
MASDRARQLLKSVSARADVFMPGASGVTILAYHRVGAGTDSDVDLPVELFSEQMARLAAGSRVVSLDDAVAMLRAPADAPPNPIVITFDDGTADFVDNAVPVLERFHLPATLYAATEFIDRAEPFWGDGAALTWVALAEATASGLIHVGSHTHTHRLLDRLAPDEIASDLDRSIDLIGEHTGRRPDHFAYPKAVPPSTAAAAAVQTRFKSAALSGTRTNRFGATDVYELARSPIQTSDGLQYFLRKAGGGMRLEGTARRIVDRRRYSDIDS